MSALIKVFDWVITSSIMASVLVAVILLVKLIMKNKQSPKWHYYIWFILLVRLLVPFAPTSSFSLFNIVNPVIEKLQANCNVFLDKTDNYIPEQNQSYENPNVIISQLNNISNNNALKNENKLILNTKYYTYKFNLKNLIILIWLAGIVILSTYIIAINTKLFIKARNHPVFETQHLNNILNKCRLNLNIKRAVPIVLTDIVSTPSLLGCTRPVLLIPRDILKDLSDREFEHIFLHELSHLKRKDNIVNCLVIFLKIIHWFNPVIWYSFYKMRQDCEISCDAMAMSYLDHEEQSEYGYTIIHLLKIASKQRWIPGAIGVLPGKSEMKRRITMISLFNKKYVKFSALGIVMLIILGCILLTNAKEDTSNTSSRAQSDTETITSANAKSSTGIGDNSVNNDNALTISQIEGGHFKAKMITVSDPKKVVVGCSLNNNSQSDKTTSQIAMQENALAAINGGGHLEDYTPDGFIIKDGKFVFCDQHIKESPDSPITDVVGFTFNGKMVTGSFTYNQLQEEYKLKEAVKCIGALIIDGKPAKLYDIYLGINPRTAIGQKANGEVLMLVVDGRSLESVGATIEEVTDIMFEFGAVNAALLDGGNSSTMYYNGKVINKPCTEGNKERIVANAFLVMP